MSRRKRGAIYLGISGWLYKGWRGQFYPPGLPHKSELAYASQQFNSLEINGSFYSLQRPEVYQSWYVSVPASFLFSVKAPRFITHMKKLKDPETPTANFFASGVLALKEKLGPMLWQLPPQLPFSEERLKAFLELLPKSSEDARLLARKHDQRMTGRTSYDYEPGSVLRHALEVRHESFRCEEFIRLLRRFNVALVVADSPGKWLFLEDVTADFVYIRMHGRKKLYASGYSRKNLEKWAEKIAVWAAGGVPEAGCCAASAGPRKRLSRDVFVYFDNDAKGNAPFDALQLSRLLERVSARNDMPGAAQRQPLS